nr:hypothetical protein [Parabacteroides sp. AM58-2XD]
MPRDRQGEFEPVIIPKHQSHGLSIEKLSCRCMPKV